MKTPTIPQSAEDLRPWLEERRARLARKKQREQAYLARRAARGTHTPTDEAYEDDQVLEAELLALLDAMLTELRTEEQP